jgi:hypothetical protein
LVCDAYRTRENRRNIVLGLDTFRRNPMAKHLVAWLLIALLPLQGMAACALATRGPLHTHRVELQLLVLEDVRRAPVAASASPVHIATAFGHFHAAGTPLRHYHRFDDTTVMAADDGGLGQAGNAGNSALDHGAGAIDGLLPTSPGWVSQAAAQTRAFHVAWAWLTFEPEPFERPPRSA